MTVISASLRSKNTLPTASILMRAALVAMLGMVTLAVPSLGVLSASTYGKVLPPSAEKVIFTALVLTGAASVPATFQVTVWVEPPFTVDGVDAEVTRNGPAAGA